ncbi:N-succinylarginine dihydrolase [Caulobacter vibrioides]|uniref:N-succinylarginine dihydrolase n=1 Tax=Caulobacter vibrioides TaxID=155892 RepID=A0A290MHT4_CAUVI|nr:N-succinylarginine dihydrolase [Caulobacter vibrioides]ATC31633.1 N-succinylarginine dihydrolase [Caulobacter vibrioides]
MTFALEANCDGLVGPTHSYVGLSPGNLASTRNAGEVSNPRGAALEGLSKMRRLADLGLPQFVLAPHERPAVNLLKALGFSGSEDAIIASAWKDAPALAAAACSASPMWAANAATVTPSADAADGRVHFTPANLLTNLHRSLEGPQTTRSLRRLFPDETRFAVHDPLPAQPHFADEGAANHVRLCAEHGAPGVNLFVWGREAWGHWDGRFPARQTREAFEAVQRRHGAARAVFPQQGKAAIEGGAFHNDVVCVGTRECLFFHERAFEDRAAMEREVRAAANGLFEPVFVEVTEAELPMADLVASYLFNSQLLVVPGEDRLVLLAPVETRDNPRAYAVAEGLAASNGPIGRVEYVDVRQSMRNGGGPACLRLRVVLTEAELAATNPAQRFTADLQETLADWIIRRYRDRLSPADLADPRLLTESREALDELTQILGLGDDFYPFQRTA